MTTARGSARRSRLVGAGLLVASFLAGALAGAAADRLLAGRGPHVWARGGGRSSDRGPGPADDLFERLDLTSDQRGRVEAILERRRGQMESFWEEAGPRLRAIVDSTHAEIRLVLTPEQRAEFDRLVAERRSRHRERHGHGSHGCGPPTGREDEGASRSGEEQPAHGGEQGSPEGNGAARNGEDGAAARPGSDSR